MKKRNLDGQIMQLCSTVLLYGCLLHKGFALPVPYPTNGWEKSTPESQSMSSAGLKTAAEWMGSLAQPDALLVVRGGFIVSETYWGACKNDSLHDMASTTKSIAALALAHAIEAGHFSTETKIADYFPALVSNDPNVSSVPLQLKHLLSMSGGANATYAHHSPAWVNGLRQGPPGEVTSCTRDGLAKKPGSSFIYSFANPAIASGLLMKTTGMSYAQYLDTHLFPVLGINRTQWRWVGDREGNSQPDGCSYHTAQNLAKLAYLLLREGRWQVGKNGTEQQLLSRDWVAGCASPTPKDWGACPYYSHFMWRKDLNHGNTHGGRKVPKDTFYTYGGGGQFAVVVPSLDLVVVILYGAKPATFQPPADVQSYKNNQFFPASSDEKILSLGTCCGGFRVDGVLSGCWNWSFSSTNTSSTLTSNNSGESTMNIDISNSINTNNNTNININNNINSDSHGNIMYPGMPSCECTPQNTAPNDLLSQVMQRVVDAVID